MMVHVTRTAFFGIITAPALAFVLVSCGPAPFGESRIDPALQKLIPPDTSMVFDAHIDRLRKTALYEKHVAPLLRQQSDQFAAKTGIDPSRDIDEVLSCSDGRNAVV